MSMICAKKTPMRVLLATFIALAPTSLAVAPAKADDAKIARKALLEGKIKPLSEIIGLVKPKLPGATILEVELDVENGRIVYEFKIIDSSGRLKEVEVDAKTADILSIEDDD